MGNDYVSVTEIAGDDVTQEQIDRLCNRYYWAGQYCAGKDVVETACGSGQGLGYLAGILITKLNELGFLELVYFHQQVYNECAYWRKYAKNTR